MTSLPIPLPLGSDSDMPFAPLPSLSEQFNELVRAKSDMSPHKYLPVETEKASRIPVKRGPEGVILESFVLRPGKRLKTGYPGEPKAVISRLKPSVSAASSVRRSIFGPMQLSGTVTGSGTSFTLEVKHTRPPKDIDFSDPTAPVDTPVFGPIRFNGKVIENDKPATVKVKDTTTTTTSTTTDVVPFKVLDLHQADPLPKPIHRPKRHALVPVRYQ